MQAVILAGGKGTRLAERLAGRPKPLVDVLGVPLLQRQIETLRTQGVDQFVILVNYAADQIEQFLDSNDHFGCDIVLIDDGEPRGSGGAVVAASDVLQDEMLIVYGDTLFDIDIAAMWEAHRRSGASGTLFLHPNDHPHDSDLVEVDDCDRILAFHPYPHPEGAFLANQVNAAFYILRRTLLEPFRGRDGILDFGKDLFPAMLAAGFHLHGYRSFEYIKDLGTPKRLDKVERHLRDGVVQRARLGQAQPCVFLDRDGTLNHLRGYVRSPDELVLMPGVPAAVRRLNDLEYRIVVVTNQPVVARGDVTEPELRTIHAKLETELGAEGAYVDRIYACPHHPDRGFPGERTELKIHCDCRKPKAGLLEKVDFMVDRERSWMIGDSTADIAAGQGYGVRTILLDTGEGGRDGKAPFIPDYTMPDLGAAVRFIDEGLPRMIAAAEPIADIVSNSDLIVIGGLARSGKSTLSSVLAECLRARGVDVAIVALDRRLHAKEARGYGVLGRYDLAAAAEDLATWLGGGELDAALPIYDRVNRRQIEGGPPVQLAADGVLILEGVPALLMPIETRRTAHRIFVGADETRRRARVIDDLQRRGATVDEAAALYASREADEAPVAVSSRQFADTILSIDTIFQDLDA